ncbi:MULTISPECIES: universal stress protein [Halorubrum]|uniref:Nucleotide-binding universal stress protein, UspA family n=1 Tax=Halorubrum sodomense TaxID=35743 RepID=A0A1I6GVJ9_HALSD|nr:MULTISPECIES: universal stress protein [Halorubrum]TKX54755.1 universal stress protein [Halorubrum sp. SP3]TKX69864.1 universal stress protein [Halorubrum sp. SP9]SFR46283.1 Nucleotide-binding universal stress protein, UspA family [Halorubrum sodomense]
MNGSDADGGSTRNGGARGGSSDSTASGDSAAPADPPGVGDTVIRPAVDDAGDVSAAADVSLKGADRADRPDRVSSVLVAVGPGPHSGATVDVAREVAAATDAWLELFHVVPSDAALADADSAEDAAGTVAAVGDADDTDYAAAGRRLLDAAEDRLGGFDRADRWLVEDRTAAGAIVEQSAYYDLVVVGAPTTGTVGRFVFGSTTDTVVGDAEVPVVVVEADGSTALDAA